MHNEVTAQVLALTFNSGFQTSHVALILKVGRGHCKPLIKDINYAKLYQNLSTHRGEGD